MLYYNFSYLCSFLIMSSLSFVIKELYFFPYNVLIFGLPHTRNVCCDLDEWFFFFYDVHVRKWYLPELKKIINRKLATTYSNRLSYFFSLYACIPIFWYIICLYQATRLLDQKNMFVYHNLKKRCLFTTIYIFRQTHSTVIL